MTESHPSQPPSEPTSAAILARWWAGMRRRILIITLLLVSLWCIPAIGFAYGSPLIRTLLALAMGVLVVVVLVVRKQRRWSIPVVAIGCAAVLAWYLDRRPTGDRDWAPPQAQVAQASIEQGIVTLENVRNFTWRTKTDFAPRWEARTYDLNKLCSLDLVLTCHGNSARIGHTCLSFGFRDGQYVHVSVESRRKEGEGFNPLAGQFRRYELIYVFSDERDSFSARVLVNGEQVHVYPTKTHPEMIRMLFVGMLAGANHLRDHPKYYNTLSQNCTTTIIDHINRIRPEVVPFDTRIWLNGRFDQLCHEYGWIASDLPFEETRAATYINDWVRTNGITPDFSARLRAYLHRVLHPRGENAAFAPHAGPSRGGAPGDSPAG